MIKILNKKFRRYTIPQLNTTFKLFSVFSEGETITLQIWDDNCPSIQNINFRFPSVNFRPWLQNVALYWCRASFFTKTKTGCPCAFFFALRKHLCFKFSATSFKIQTHLLLCKTSESDDIFLGNSV